MARIFLLVVGKLPRQVFPLAAGFGELQHGIDYFAHIQFNRASGTTALNRQQGLQQGPLAVAQLTGVMLHFVTHWFYSCSVGNGLARTSILPNRNIQMASKKPFRHHGDISSRMTRLLAADS